MKIIFVAFAVLTAVNLAAASADSIRFSTEATAILTDYETRIPPVIGTVLPRFTTIVNTAIGNYAAVRKTLNDQLSALGPVGAALGSTLVKAIKVDQAAITPSVNLALLKTNLTIILSGFNSIFAEVSAGITSDAAIIDQYPTAISCWENGKQQVMDTEASSALAFEQMTAYNLQDTADNVTPVQGQIGFLGNEVNTFIAAAAAAPQPLSYYTDNQAAILATFAKYGISVGVYLNWQIQVILETMADQLQSDLDFVQQEVPVLKACFAQAMQ